MEIFDQEQLCPGDKVVIETDRGFVEEAIPFTGVPVTVACVGPGDIRIVEDDRKWNWYGLVGYKLDPILEFASDDELTEMLFGN